VLFSTKKEVVMDTKLNIPLILKRMLEAVMILAPVLMIALPFLVSPLKQVFTGERISGSSQSVWITLMFLEISGIFCWFIVFFLQRLLKTTIKDSPFVHKNVLYLKYISYLCAAIAIVLIVKTFVDFSILTPVVALIALLASLFCQTLAAVFDKAVKLKDENDLTI
jgi:hypothetical protein